MAQGGGSTGIYDALNELLAKRTEESRYKQAVQEKLAQQALENQLRERQAKAAEQTAGFSQEVQRVGLMSPNQTMSPQDVASREAARLGGTLRKPQQLEGIPQFSGTLDENRIDGAPQTRNVGTFSQLEAQAVQKRLEEQAKASLAQQQANVDATNARTDANIKSRESEGALNRAARVKAALMSANKPSSALVAVQTVENGKKVTKFVEKRAGDTYEAPLGATSSNRADSAEAVTKTGNDIIAQVADPKFAQNLGPVMGRYTTLRDFIGNPPPEYSELAGEIESYALANMGVHGMRSTVGAQQIKDLLDQRHTPESLSATIRGLNQFSRHFLETTGRAQGQMTPTAGPNKKYNPATGKVE